MGKGLVPEQELQDIGPRKWPVNGKKDLSEFYFS
ncbi:hypothetical protein SLEP1_g58923 [Rubroshorea leprosula]|uniref:Uncharacterized protein n=1 Tax=Rubroshorea leprosula TaxID=152421 RepID=A0AAV5MTA7_9ROSI|nr:hypothetical protein SLEP1_g58923 [Rubroshorea leprosula]